MNGTRTYMPSGTGPPARPPRCSARGNTQGRTICAQPPDLVMRILGATVGRVARPPEIISVVALRNQPSRPTARRIRRSARRDAHDRPSAVRADQGDRRSVGNARSSSRIEGVERPTSLCAGWRVRPWSPGRPCSGASARFRIRARSQGVSCAELARRPGGYGVRSGGLGWRWAGLPVSEPAGASGYWSAGEHT